MQQAPKSIVVGGGAAGFFAAIACAEAMGDESRGYVTIYEATDQPLIKVLISGGGRCNVTNACFEPRELSKRYPRGNRELIGPLSKFGPRETVAWFEERGVKLKAEEDGRMFPVTDLSRSISDCLLQAASFAGVQLVKRKGVTAVRKLEQGGFELSLSGGEIARCDRLLIASGGGVSSGGYAIAQSLGHTVEPPVPSLFTFKVEDPRLAGLAGLAVENAELRIPDTKLREQGPVLITHWGLSGPATLRLSAWGARELAARGYTFPLSVNWVPPLNREAVLHELSSARSAHPKRQLNNGCDLHVPSRLWERLVEAAGIRLTDTWAGISNEALARLASQLCEGTFSVLGKSTNKEEFVTCGGVRLKEVDFRTMESRLCPGLYFAGEVLDIDGITGGFNFQAAWCTGWLAGNAMAAPRA
jgi:predicted Rossmann fold flavoprotein